jgi:hypothetical protein
MGCVCGSVASLWEKFLQRTGNLHKNVSHRTLLAAMDRVTQVTRNPGGFNFFLDVVAGKPQFSLAESAEEI